MPKSDKYLRVTEIFYSLQGETRFTGLPTVFVRLTGCPLRCHYCDTEYAFHNGTSLSIATILNQVANHQAQYVTVTGGEPLAQPHALHLLNDLCDAGYCVSLETSGALDISPVDLRVIKILDLKTPASGEYKRNRYANLRYLTPNDQIKIVICDHSDYLWAKELLISHQLPEICDVLFSPSHNELPNHALADWILADKLPVRMQIQLHKFIWGDKPGV